MKKNKQQSKQVYMQRVKCNCVAQKHELINNCLGCGKVVCAQQGEGPCLYCGNIVTKPDGKYIVNDQALFPTLPKQQLSKISQERSKAIIHKNILIQRDKSTNLVQNIYDESIDYYDVSQNQWLDEQSRQNAIDKLLEKDKYVQAQKLKQKIVFDPLTGKFVAQQFSFDEQSFKQQGRNYMKQKQKEQYSKKMSRPKQNWDSRLFNNDKLKEIVTQLRSELPQAGTTKKQETKIADNLKNKNRVTQLIMQDEDTVENESMVDSKNNSRDQIDDKSKDNISKQQIKQQ